MTFYDIVTLIVPGALVLCANGWFPFIKDVSWLSYIALFGVILTIGLALKSLSIWWSGLWFRNNANMIQIAKDANQDKLLDFACTFFCGPIMYVFSPFSSKWFLKKDENLLKLYYDKYEIAYNNEYSGKRIELLECQVAFLQSWSWAICACLISLIFNKCRFLMFKQIQISLDWWALLIVIYACIVAMFILQKKIYRVVWDTIEPKNVEKEVSNANDVERNQ